MIRLKKVWNNNLILVYYLKFEIEGFFYSNRECGFIFICCLFFIDEYVSVIYIDLG